MKLIGEILSETCDLTQEVISQALRLQRGNGLRLGEILVGQNLISEPELQNALSIQARMQGYGADEGGGWLDVVPEWLKIGLVATGAIVGIWLLSSVLLNLVKVFGQ